MRAFPIRIDLVGRAFANLLHKAVARGLMLTIFSTQLFAHCMKAVDGIRMGFAKFEVPPGQLVELVRRVQDSWNTNRAAKVR